MGLDECQLKSLLMRGLAGDPAAYRNFLYGLQGLLRRYVVRQLLSMSRSERDAEDIVQEALIAIHTRRHTYEAAVPVTAWAYAITRYKLIDFLRSTKREMQILPLEEMDGAVDGSGPIEDAIAVQKIVATLPRALRVPIELVKLKGLTAKEAARLAGVSEPTIRVNVHRGLKMLVRRFRSR